MALATVTPPWAYTLQLPQDPRGPGVARATLRTVLRVHGMRHLVDTAELLAGELVTNAYRHSSGPYSLRLRGAGRNRVRVGVWDSCPEIPDPFGGGGVAEAPEVLAERGRGLYLVQEYADSWGAYPIRGGLPGQGGKVLWVECVGEPECRGAPWRDRG
ncbi:ATP-binding protein [Streptomyces sp. B1I3]|uniref:ATP-binding protein n=1 Tax=Streptomyces sp. B1I3 TaxID=3042264 RepID=UPI002785ACC1|nr:ATP-binding protein [Streptomyces sp. B1I3]MDQ0794947.1 anti-sigma regulatory factor (Ser/Thr protein kinase) [Streptomyces sp. B1I3]